MSTTREFFLTRLRRSHRDTGERLVRLSGRGLARSALARSARARRGLARTEGLGLLALLAEAIAWTTLWSTREALSTREATRAAATGLVVATRVLAEEEAAEAADDQ
jgi:hypothetical protein